MVPLHELIMLPFGTQWIRHCGFMEVLMGWLAKTCGDLRPWVLHGTLWHKVDPHLVLIMWLFGTQHVWQSLSRAGMTKDYTEICGSLKCQFSPPQPPIPKPQWPQATQAPAQRVAQVAPALVAFPPWRWLLKACHPVCLLWSLHWAWSEWRRSLSHVTGTDRGRKPERLSYQCHHPYHHHFHHLHPQNHHSFEWTCKCLCHRLALSNHHPNLSKLELEPFRCIFRLPSIVTFHPFTLLHSATQIHICQSQTKMICRCWKSYQQPDRADPKLQAELSVPHVCLISRNLQSMHRTKDLLHRDRMPAGAPDSYKLAERLKVPDHCCQGCQEHVRFAGNAKELHRINWDDVAVPLLIGVERGDRLYIRKKLNVLSCNHMPTTHLLNSWEAVSPFKIRYAFCP